MAASDAWRQVARTRAPLTCRRAQIPRAMHHAPAAQSPLRAGRDVWQATGVFRPARLSNTELVPTLLLAFYRKAVLSPQNLQRVLARVVRRRQRKPKPQKCFRARCSSQDPREVVPFLPRNSSHQVACFGLLTQVSRLCRREQETRRVPQLLLFPLGLSPLRPLRRCGSDSQEAPPHV